MQDEDPKRQVELDVEVEKEIKAKIEAIDLKLQSDISKDERDQLMMQKAALDDELKAVQKMLIKDTHKLEK